MFQKFTDAVKRYSGYSRFVAPYWAIAVRWAADHPQTMLALLIAAILI